MLRRVLATLLILLAAGEVRANYTEAHVAGEDARVVVQRDGRMTVTHVVAYRVLAGTLRSIAITGFEDGLSFHPTAQVTSADGKTFGASVTRDDKGVLHATVDDPKGLKRGDYRFELVYEGTLVGRVARDGAFDRVRFALPPMREGVDGARVVLDLPSAPTEPRAVSEGDVAADISNLRRSAERDELEMVRPHVPKGEGATFFARIDPKALPLVNDPALRASPPPPPEEITVTKPTLPIAILVCLSALALFALGLAKSRVMPREASGLVPGAAAVRAVLAGVAFGAGVLFEAQARFVLGAAFVAVAMIFCAWRVKAPASRAARGTAPWTAVKPEDAFTSVASASDWLDGTTRRGALVLAALAVVVAIACHLSRGIDGAAPYVVAIDALVVAAVFFTGTARQLPQTPAREGVALAPIARALAKHGELDAKPFSRSDETRLFVTSGLAMPGAVAIEIGVAWERAPSVLGGASVASFDVLVRVLDGTFAAAKMAGAFPKKRALPGRKPEERVFRFEPEGPHAKDAAALALSLSETLRDRRVAGSVEGGTAQWQGVIAAAAFDGAERRLP
ncbi:MAG TPA: hypothetical protein VGH87_02775, partial [Polyangiaceae bacterium]